MASHSSSSSDLHHDATNTSKFKVAIVGGGVCGLTCALALARTGIHAQVFEAAARFGEIGAGVGFGPNAVRVLKDLGLFDEILANSGEEEATLSTFAFYDGAEGHPFVHEFPVHREDLNIGVHRATYLDTVVKSLDTGYTQHNKRCVTVSHDPTEKPTVYFEDGTTYEADIVLGADGIKSAVRAAVLQEDAPCPVVYANTYCYRGLISVEDIRDAGVKTELTERPVCFLGVDKHLIMFPIKNATFVNVVAFVTDRSVPLGSIERPKDEPWVVPVTQEEMLAEYEGWGSDVQKILGCIRTPSKWMIRVVQPLSSYVKGTVALLGDAAHGMLPHLGAGAGQALEDAHLISKLLGHPETTLENVHLVLEAYDHTRRKRAQMVWDGSVSAGATYAGRGEHGSSLQGLLQDLPLQWESQKAVWRHTPSSDYRDAVTYLQQRQVFRSTFSTVKLSSSRTWLSRLLIGGWWTVYGQRRRT